MRVLITGAGGQVGRDLLAALTSAGAQVDAADIVGPGSGGGDGSIRWHRLDVTDAGAVLELFRELRPPVVYHLAAILSLRGEQDPQRTYQVNMAGTYNVLEACRQAGVGRVMFTSSIAVFGAGDSEGAVRGAGDMVTEVTKPRGAVVVTEGNNTPGARARGAGMRPSTMYGVTKVAGELLGEYYFRRYGLDFRGVRFPGLISAGRPGGGSSDYALHMYVEAVRVGRYTANCRPDTRIPLMYMPDALRALLALSGVERARLRSCVYNLAGMSPRAEEIAASVMAAVPGSRIDFRPDEGVQAILDSWPEALDDSEARRDWGWRAEFDLEAMTRDLVPRVRAMLGGVGLGAGP